MADYPVVVSYDEEDRLYIATFPDLPGCSAQGATEAEARESAVVAKAEWMRLTLELGLPIPKPSI